MTKHLGDKSNDHHDIITSTVIANTSAECHCNRVTPVNKKKLYANKFRLQGFQMISKPKYSHLSRHCGLFSHCVAQVLRNPRNFENHVFWVKLGKPDLHTGNKFLSRESAQSAIRARLGVASHLATTPRWGNRAKCLSQWHNK